MTSASCKTGEAKTVCIDAPWTSSEATRTALAFGGDLLAFSDPATNSVIVLEQGADASWSHLRDIPAPSGSAFDKLGRGFGYDLAIDGKRLIIGAFTAPDDHLPVRVWTDLTPGARVGAVYTVDLAGDGAPERLFPDAVDLLGFDVEAADGVVAASVIRIDDDGQAEGAVVMDRDGVAEKISAPEGSPTLAFGYAISLGGGRLGVGAPQEAGAWFYDHKTLADPTFLGGKPGSTGFAGTGVVQGANFSAISAATGMGVLRTTIHRAGEAAVVLDMGGRLSSAGDLLAISQPASEDHERSPSVGIFRITDSGVEDLKILPGAIAASVMANGWVATIRPEEERPLCLERII